RWVCGRVQGLEPLPLLGRVAPALQGPVSPDLPRRQRTGLAGFGPAPGPDPGADFLGTAFERAGVLDAARMAHEAENCGGVAGDEEKVGVHKTRARRIAVPDEQGEREDEEYGCEPRRAQAGER